MTLPRRRELSAPVKSTAKATSVTRRHCRSLSKESSSNDGNSPSVSSSRKKHYLIGSSITKLGVSKLPKNGAVIARLLDICESGHKLDDSIRLVRTEIRDVWKHHFGVGLIFGKCKQDEKGRKEEKCKLIVTDTEIAKRIKNLYTEWNTLQKDSKRPERNQKPAFKKRECDMKEKLMDTLNISKEKAESVLMHSGIIDWKIDLQHLEISWRVNKLAVL